MEVKKEIITSTSFFLAEFMLKLLSQDSNENIRIKYSMFV